MTESPHHPACRTEDVSWQDQVVAMAFEGIITVTREGVILTANPAAARIFGRSPIDLIGQHLNVLIPERFHSRHQGYIERWSASGESSRPMTGRTSVPACRADGSEFRADISLIRFEERGETRFAALIRDVTAREEHEEQVRRARALADAILDRAPSLVAVLDASGRIERINRATERLLGISQAAAAGADAFDAAYGDAEREAARERFVDLVASGEIGSTRDTVSVSGGWARVHWVAAPIRDRTGRIAHVICIGNDITQQEQAEERFRELFEGARDLILTTSMNGQVRAANRAAELLTGYTRDELTEMNALDLLNRHERSRAVDLLAAGAQSASDLQLMELTLVTRAGESIPVEVSANVMREHGEVRGFHVMARDIRARRALEAERTAIERAMQDSQRLEAVGLLAAGVAHDFNNVLTAITGNAALAGFDLPPESPVQEYLHEIERATRRASDLAHQLLTYAGKSPRRLERLDLNAVVAEMTQMLRVSVPHGVELRRSFAAHLPEIEGDPTQLRQVILNLITNAAEAISGGGVIAVTTSTLVPGPEFAVGAIPTPEKLAARYVVLEVCDTGAGLDAEMLAHIFEPFFTTKQVERGRGLGLAAVLGIVRGHRGALKVASEPGKGTTFSVFLPAHERA